VIQFFKIYFGNVLCYDRVKVVTNKFGRSRHVSYNRIWLNILANNVFVVFTCTFQQEKNIFYRMNRVRIYRGMTVFWVVVYVLIKLLFIKPKVFFYRKSWCSSKYAEERYYQQSQIFSAIRLSGQLKQNCFATIIAIITKHKDWVFNLKNRFFQFLVLHDLWWKYYPANQNGVKRHFR